MSEPNEDKGYQQILDIISEDESITILNDMLKNAAKITRKLEQIINSEFRADTIDEFKRAQSDIDKYSQHNSKLRSMTSAKDTLTGMNIQKYDEFVNSMLNQITKGVGNQFNKTRNRFGKLITQFFNRDLKQDGQGIQTEINLICTNYYLLGNSILSETLKKNLTFLPPSHQPNPFILSYGHAVHSIASFRDDKIDAAYLKATSPMEVRVVSDSLEKKLTGIISNERPFIEDYLDVFPVNIADVSRKQKKKFLNESLTPKINALYREMQLVCSSGMKYFNLKRELRADAMYLERSAGLVQRVGNKIKDNTKKESPTTDEVKELLEISTHQNYFLLHKELEGMVFVGREAKRYNELYSQVISEAKALLLKIDDDIRKNGKVIVTVIESEKKYEKAVGINNNPSQLQIAQETIPPVQEAISSQTAAQRPKLEVISGCAVVKTSPRAEKAGVQAKIVETKAYASPYIPSTTPAYDITTKLDDIKEPENPELKAFYNLLHRRDVYGRFIIAYPTEIVQMFGDIKLQEEGKSSGRYSEADKSFIRTVMGYLNNQETLMYGEIKGSDVIQSAPRLMHDVLMIIR